jgi:hypothetical protein
MGIFDQTKKTIHNSSEITSDNLFLNLMTEIESSNTSYNSDNFKSLSSFQVITNLSDKNKVDFLVFLIQKKDKEEQSRNRNYEITELLRRVLDLLIKSKIIYEDIDVQKIISAFLEAKHMRSYFSVFEVWPINQFLTKIVSQYKGKELSDTLKSAFKNLKEDTNNSVRHYSERDRVKIVDKIDTLVFEADNKFGAVKPFLFMGEDELSDYANEQILNFSEAEKLNWYKIIAEAQKANGAKPTAKFLSETKTLLNALGLEKFKKNVNEWFVLTINTKDEMPDQRYYVGSFAISNPNVDTLKGLVWMCSHLNDNETICTIARLAERSYQKIPNKGPAAASLGNACLFTLYKTKGLEGIGQLSRLKLRIKQNNTQNIIEKYLNQAAEEQGISVYEIEDLATDDFDLINGERTWEFDGYKAEISILRVGKTEIKWLKPDGSLQKTIPTFVKEKYVQEFKELKNLVKQIEQNISAQRDRIDRMFRSGRKMSWEHFENYYLSHGLLSFISKKIIWNFTHNKATFSAIFENNGWKNSSNEVVNPAKESFVSLWHPALETIENITKWRNYLVENEIQQPIKQAFREVYLLTTAEINTKSYSNRMAAHILKQHQFNVLAKTRGWKYSLMGNYDGGRENETAEILLKEDNLVAEFCVNEVNAGNQLNDAGIWNYVVTDQVRFINLENDEKVNLIDVPAQVFSEIMRDVDLFVGVASVGNDPTWQDTGGLSAYRDYWQSYSFGDLSEVAKMRKDILTNLLPSLKINKVAEIKDKFLVVKGTLRTYKIHIGSTNILMEPNDQYLCIVPDRGAKNHAENLFLLFEGDSGLSVILSKAFLLAADDKITDSKITSQINQK